MAEPSEYGYAAEAQRQAIKDLKMRLFIAGCLSSVIPGVGHLFRKLRKRGLLWLAGFVAFLIATVLIKPWRDSDGIMIAFVLGSILFAAAGIDAAFASTEEDLRTTKWAALLFACIAFIASISLSQLVWRVNGYNTISVFFPSMDPTIKLGDTVVVDTNAFRHARPGRGDVVLARAFDQRDMPWRVTAIPGDTIEGKNGQITLNNVQIRESYVSGGATSIDVSSSDDERMKKLYTFGPVKLGPDEYFLMGDNRPLSQDSRINGPVKLSSIHGKALYIINKNDDARDGKHLD